jgi:aminobenzoyl-glutamate utilization protein B
MQVGFRWIEEHAPELIALSQAIWGYAELGLQETRSAAAQATFLEREGFQVQLGVAGLPTALVASFGEGKPIIGYLGEYDALGGLAQKAVPYQDTVEGAPTGHGCGHNLLGVGSLAAAVALKREIEAGRTQGCVRYYGCPGEEAGDGKVHMAHHGLFDDLDAALTWHPGWLNAPVYRSSTAINSVRFAFHGRSAHAAGAPHLGISALDAVELTNVGVNYLREHVIQEARIHYVITRGGEAPNVVPPEAEVWYFVRAPRRQDLAGIYARVVQIAQGAALMTGAQLEVKFEGGLYEYLPNEVITKVMEESLLKVGPPPFSAEDWAFAREMEKAFVPDQKASLLRANDVPPDLWETSLHNGVAPDYGKSKCNPGSTDVGDVSWVVPTGQITAATFVMGAAGHSWQVTATAGMGIGHKGMLVAAKAMALAGYELLSRPELVCQAREVFQRDTQSQPYVAALAQS